jgi:hypothetical protein
VTSLAAPLLVLALAACGDPAAGPGIASADGGGATPSATASNGASQGDPVKFADCMRQHGIEVEVPGGGGGGPIRVKGKAGDEGKMEEAQQACRQYAPSGGPGDGQPMPKEDQEKFLKFAKCMRDHGIPMADPEFEGGGVKMRINDDKGAAKIDDSKTEAAQKACESILPEPPDGAGEGPQQGGPGAGAAVGGGA